MINLERNPWSTLWQVFMRLTVCSWGLRCVWEAGIQWLSTSPLHKQYKSPLTLLILVLISCVLDMKRGILKASLLWLLFVLIKKWAYPQRSRRELLDQLHNQQQGYGALLRFMRNHNDDLEIVESYSHKSIRSLRTFFPFRILIFMCKFEPVVTSLFLFLLHWIVK